MTTDKKPLVIFGTGDIGELACFYFNCDSSYRPIAFTVDREFVRGQEFNGLPVIPFDEILEQYPPGEADMFIAVSYAKLNMTRLQKFQEAVAWGYDLPSYISSRATIWPDLSACKNCFILEDNTIQPFVTIGDNVTLWSGNHIGHHSRIRSHTFLASHIVVSGGCDIGERCFIGVNATLHDHVSVGDGAIIAAGALIKKDVAPDSLYTAAPARHSDTPASEVRL